MVQRWLGAFVLVLSVATGSQAAIQVAGRVVGPGGAPVPEAKVELLARGGNVPGAAMVLDGRDRPEPAATTRTQADGTYRLEAPAPGMWRVRVEAPGFAPLQADLVPLLEPADLPDAALVADAGLTVRVAGPGGAPAAGALVVVRPDEGRPRPRAAGFWTGALRVGRTGPEGTVKFARGGNERLVVSATAPGLPLAASKGARGQSVALSLPKGRVVVIEVRDAAGQPVPGAALADPDDRHPLALSGDDGRCTLAVAGNSIGVWAGSPEGASTKAELALPQETKDRPVVITLPAVREVSGRVIDVTTRRPIAGAIIWTPRAGIDFVVSGESGAYSLVVPARREVGLAAAAAGYLESDFRDAAVSPLAADAPTIALQPAAEVRGVVVDADGNAVAGAEVLATTAPRGPRDRIIVRIGDERSGPRALTGARGEFRVGQLDPAEGWVLTARAAGRAPGRAEVSGLVPHEIREGLRIELQPGATLTGRVVDAAGKPVRGATASLKAAPPEARGMRMFGPAPGDAALPEQRADSDAEGHFAIADLPAGRFDLTVRRAGFATRTLPAIDIAADGQPRDVGAITLEPGARVEGRVTDPAGAPIDDVTVMLIGGDAMAAAVAMMTGGEGQATTAADGWFRIDDRREGETVDIVFRREGYGPQRLSGIAAPTLTPLAVTLQPASSISGSVADGEGRPIAGAEVTATRALGGPRGPGMFMMFNFVRPVDTDEQGKFTVDGLEPGKISLSVNAAGWQPHAREVEVPAGEDVTGVAVVLEPGAVVEGRVLGPDGAPVSGAQVGPVAGRQGGPGPRFRGAVQTDGDGRYRLEELLPGPASIEAEKQGFGRAVRDIELRTGANELDLQFEGGPPVSGVVLDPDGAPVPNADVRLNVAGQPWGGPTASTAADGTFRFERVAPGEYELDAAARGFAPSRGEVRVQVESEAVSGLEVRLARGGAIAGTVTGLAPEEYPDVDVLVVCRESWSMQRADVNFEGRFRVDGLAPCRYDVQGTVARTGRQARAEVELAAGAAEAAVELPFGLGLKLSGRVLLARQPVSGALVFASADNGRGTAPVRTDQEGKFNLEGLEADTYTVQVMEWSKGISHREVVVLDATRDITINIPTSRVAGRVLDAGDRQPIAGAVVTLTREGDDNPMRGMAGMGAATSAADGAFSIDHVAPGAWKLSARKDGYAVSGQLVSVMSGQDAGNVEVVLEPTEGLTLEVRLPGGRPASQVELALLDAAGQVMSTGTRQTGENGRVRLASAPAGSWELLIGAPGAAMLSTGVTAPGGPYAIELPPACRLQVRVADLAATRGSGAISLVGADGRQQRFLAWGGALNELRLVDGQINFEQLPPGQWTVYVRGDDGRTWRGTVATIPGAPASLSL